MQQVDRSNLGLAILLRRRLRFLEGFLGLDGELLEFHRVEHLSAYSSLIRRTV
jgi:hypothetical protein